MKAKFSGNTATRAPTAAASRNKRVAVVDTETGVVKNIWGPYGVKDPPNQGRGMVAPGGGRGQGRPMQNSFAFVRMKRFPWAATMVERVKSSPVSPIAARPRACRPRSLLWIRCWPDYQRMIS